MLRPLALLAGAVLLSAPGARAADEPKDVIEKAIKAHGGAEMLTKYKAATARNKGKINIPGVGEVEFTQETASMLPDKFKDSMELTVGGQTINILTLVNGDKAVIEVNGKAIDIPDAAKAALKDVGHLLKVGRLAALTGKGYELSLIGEDTVGEKAVVGVRVSAKGQKDVNLYFDKKTHLLAKTEFRSVDANGTEVNEERIVTEYGKKDGMPIPKKVIIKHDGKQFLEAEVLEINMLESLDESEFKK